MGIFSSINWVSLCLATALLSFQTSEVFAKKSCRELLSKDLNPEWVKKMRKAAESKDPQTKRLQDIVQNFGFSNAAYNRDIIKEHNDRYTFTLPRGYISDQHGSGRCWIFAAGNMIRSVLLAQKRIDVEFEFSQNYIWFFHFLEQTNKAIEDLIKERGQKFSPIKYREHLLFEPQEGGQFEYFAFLANKYGLVPKSEMPETFQSVYPTDLVEELSREMVNIIDELQSRIKSTKNSKSAEYFRKDKDEWMSRIWTILATHLGNPPDRFLYRYSQVDDTDRDHKLGTARAEPAAMINMTPTEFASKFAGFKAEEFLTFAADPLLEAGKLYEVRDGQMAVSDPKDKRFPRRFINVTPSQLEDLMVGSIKKGIPVWAAVDIVRDADHNTGILHPDLYERGPLYNFPEKKFSDKKGFFHRFYQARHAVVYNGLDWPDNMKEPVKLRMENSWSVYAGDWGIYHAYMPWVRKYTYEAVFHDSTLSPKFKEMANQKPIILDPKEDF